LIKTTRHHQSQERLKDLTTLSIETDILENIDFDRIINYFAS